MNSLSTRYRELLALTQLYLLREYDLKGMKTINSETAAYFQRNSALPAILENYPRKMTPTPSTERKASPVPIPLPPPLPVPKSSIPSENKKESPQPIPMKMESKSSVQSSPEPRLQNTTSKSLALEPFSSHTGHDLSEFWKLYRELFPDLPTCETIPIDSAASKVKNAWQKESIIPPVIIISFRNDEKENAFLKNVAQAISLRLAEARVVSAANWVKERSWDELLNSPNLRLLISTDYDLYLQPDLMKIYRESPQHGKHYLGRIPLLLLSELSLYLKEPQLKSLLWRAICNEFAVSQYAHNIP